MESLDFLRRLFAYDRWANSETLGALHEQSPDAAQRIAAHIIATERLWLSRIRNEPAPLPVWPEWKIDESRSHLVIVSTDVQEYVAALTRSDLAQTVTYLNSKGESFTSSIVDILTHVVIHGGYHRGQIATLVRQSGTTPAYTDFIHCTRQGLI